MPTITLEFSIPNATVPEVITEEWLKTRNACYDGRRRFNQAFPTGRCIRSEANIRKAVKVGAQIDWVLASAAREIVPLYNLVRHNWVPGTITAEELLVKVYALPAERVAVLEKEEALILKRLAAEAKKKAAVKKKAATAVRRFRTTNIYPDIPLSINAQWLTGLTREEREWFGRRWPSGMRRTPPNVQFLVLTAGLPRIRKIAERSAKLKKNYTAWKARADRTISQEREWWIGALAIANIS